MYQAEPDLDDTLARLERELDEFHRIKASLSTTLPLESGAGQVQVEAEPALVAALD